MRRFTCLQARHSLALALAAAVSLALPPPPAAAQPPKRIGFINVGPAAANVQNVEAFRAGLREAGQAEGRAIVVDYRWADGKVDRLPALVGELLAQRPDLIVSTGGAPTVMAVKAATSTVPIVFITGDPLAEGVVSSLARPGANLTGFAVLADEVESKRLELLRQVAPRTRRLAVVWNPARPAAAKSFRAMAETARVMGLEVLAWEARDAASLESAFGGIAKDRADALIVLPDPVLGFERARIVEFANRQRLPGVYFWREFAQAGGLLSYGTSLAGTYRRAATYVDKILRGAKPGDLPIEQPTTFELVVNLKTARALGLTVPSSMVAVADEVIQ